MHCCDIVIAEMIVKRMDFEQKRFCFDVDGLKLSSSQRFWIRPVSLSLSLSFSLSLSLYLSELRDLYYKTSLQPVLDLFLEAA